MAAFMPGASPPLVKTARFLMVVLVPRKKSEKCFFVFWLHSSRETRDDAGKSECAPYGTLEKTHWAINFRIAATQV
jgi:hypothetical protein